ncbi:hypothetical protein [Microbulbifer sp. MCCC 1A16149]|uniref:hypothetical protein n=1 Tax=Microbulbifer sp. MCCC 1A16149 TaxID=3411322 RepID=UPI003D0C4C17
MNRPKINSELLKLLKSGEFDVFTCPALTSAYFDLPSCKNTSKKGANKLISRHVKLLLSESFAERVSAKNTRPISYRLTKKFYQNHGHTDQKVSDVGEVKSKFTSELKDRMRNYKIEILEAVGEVEEYEEISLASPENLTEIKELYRQARDRYSRTHGKIKALEKMLATIEQAH